MSSSEPAPVAPWPSASLMPPREVEHDALVVRVAVDAVDHVPAHLPQADEPQLHQTNLLTSSGPSTSTRTTSRPCARSVCMSPERLRVLQVLERVAGVGDLHVVGAALVELDEQAVRGAALVVLPGRVEVARPVAERGRALRALAQLACAARSAAASYSSDGVTKPRIAMYFGGSALASRSSSEPGSSSGRPSFRIRAVLSFASCTFGWSNGLIPSAQPATAVANSAKKKIRPRSPAPPLNDPRGGRVPGAAERLDLRVHVLVRLVLVAEVREHAVVAVDVRGRRAARPPPAGCPCPPCPSTRRQLLDPQAEARDRLGRPRR